MSPRRRLVARLRLIFEGLRALLHEHGPAEVAVERVFVSRNADSALKLGQARGAALCAIPAGRAGVRIRAARDQAGGRRLGRGGEVPGGAHDPHAAAAARSPRRRTPPMRSPSPCATRTRAAWARCTTSRPVALVAGAAMIGSLRGRIALQDPAATHRRCRWARLRARSADVDFLPPAGGRRGSAAAHAPGGARGRARAVRVRHRGRATAVPQPHQGVGRRSEDRTRAALRHQRHGVRRRACNARTSPR